MPKDWRFATHTTFFVCIIHGQNLGNVQTFTSISQLRRLISKAKKFKSSHRRCSIKELFLKMFTTFTGKHLCWSFQACNFIKKIFLRTPILKNICERLLIQLTSAHSNTHTARNFGKVSEFSYELKFKAFLHIQTATLSYWTQILKYYKHEIGDSMRNTCIKTCNLLYLKKSHTEFKKVFFNL